MDNISNHGLFSYSHISSNTTYNIEYYSGYKISSKNGFLPQRLQNLLVKKILTHLKPLETGRYSKINNKMLVEAVIALKIQSEIRFL